LEVNILAWIKWLFKRPARTGHLVPFYDVPSRKVVHIPPTELRPGCVQVRMQGLDEIVWMLPEQLQEGPIWHPPFDEEIRSVICQIRDAFAEHRALTFEGWEDGFRRDTHPDREIAMWSYAADVYLLFAEREQSPERRRDIYQLLVACMTTSPESVWHVVELTALSRHDAEGIVRRFYGGKKVGDGVEGG
jgi:hypothetical protein